MDDRHHEKQRCSDGRIGFSVQAAPSNSHASRTDHNYSFRSRIVRCLVVFLRRCRPARSDRPPGFLLEPTQPTCHAICGGGLPRKGASPGDHLFPERRRGRIFVIVMSAGVAERSLHQVMRRSGGAERTALVVGVKGGRERQAVISRHRHTRRCRAFERAWLVSDLRAAPAPLASPWYGVEIQLPAKSLTRPENVALEKRGGGRCRHRQKDRCTARSWSPAP